MKEAMAHIAPVLRLEDEHRRQKGRRNMLYGAVVGGAGIAITLSSFTTADTIPGGGVFIVAYGAIAAGIGQFLVGWVRARG